MSDPSMLQTTSVTPSHVKTPRQPLVVHLRTVVHFSQRLGGRHRGLAMKGEVRERLASLGGAHGLVGDGAGAAVGFPKHALGDRALLGQGDRTDRGRVDNGRRVRVDSRTPLACAAHTLSALLWQIDQHLPILRQRRRHTGRPLRVALRDSGRLGRRAVEDLEHEQRRSHEQYLQCADLRRRQRGGIPGWSRRAGTRISPTLKTKAQQAAQLDSPRGSDQIYPTIEMLGLQRRRRLRLRRRRTSVIDSSRFMFPSFPFACAACSPLPVSSMLQAVNKRPVSARDRRRLVSECHIALGFVGRSLHVYQCTRRK